MRTGHSLCYSTYVSRVTRSRRRSGSNLLDPPTTDCTNLLGQHLIAKQQQLDSFVIPPLWLVVRSCLVALDKLFYNAIMQITLFDQ